MAIDRPVLPVGCTGGDSERFWQRYGDLYRSTLAPHGLTDELAARLANPASLSSPESIKTLAAGIASTIYSVAAKRCLVLMPFGDDDQFYEDVIVRAVEAANYQPDRIDRIPAAGDIREIFRDRVTRSHGFIVDVTGANPNVMYELGHVWAVSETKPLLILRRPLDKTTYDALPFYLKPLQIASADANTAEGRSALASRITAFLSSKHPT